MKHYTSHGYMFHIPYKPSLIKDTRHHYLLWHHVLVNGPHEDLSWVMKRFLLQSTFLSHSHTAATTKILFT